jgi:hypothetical protein
VRQLSPLGSIERLRRAAVVLMEQGGEEGAEIAIAIADYEAECRTAFELMAKRSAWPTLDGMLGLVPRHGGRRWVEEEAQLARAAALRAIASRHYPNLDPTKQARAIATAAARYESSAWRRERRNAAPAEADRSLAADLHRLFKRIRGCVEGGAALAPSARSIRDALDAEMQHLGVNEACYTDNMENEK